MTSLPIKRWVINSQKEDLSGLSYEDAVLGVTLGPEDVLVEMRAGSINYRDLVIGKVNTPLPPDLLDPFTPYRRGIC